MGQTACTDRVRQSNWMREESKVNERSGILASAILQTLSMITYHTKRVITKVQQEVRTIEHVKTNMQAKTSGKRNTGDTMKMNIMKSKEYH